MNFPTLVYRTPGPHFASTGTYDYRAANSPGDLEEAKAHGWFLTLPEALAGKHDDVEAEPEDNAAPTREELESKATELGIEFKKNTTDKVLGEKIAFVLAEQEQ